MIKITSPRTHVDVYIAPAHVVAIWRHADDSTRIRLVDGTVREDTRAPGELARLVDHETRRLE